jgi:hypothetical protein
MEWKDITGYPGYRISNMGNVWSNKLKRVLDSPVDKDGYYRIGLWNKQVVKKFRVHRLVALHFIPNPENKPVVNHIDGDVKNNHISNLEWNTVEENNRHSREVLGNVPQKGIHTKPITLTKDGVDYDFAQTNDAQKFLKASGKSFKRLKDGLKPTINGYKIKNIPIV